MSGCDCPEGTVCEPCRKLGALIRRTAGGITVMSTLFDDRGRYALTPEQRTCTRCGRVLVGEDELGLYYQVPVTEELPPDLQVPGFRPATLTFMDRVHECGEPASPHQLPGTAP